MRRARFLADGSGLLKGYIYIYIYMVIYIYIDVYIYIYIWYPPQYPGVVASCIKTIDIYSVF